MFENDVFLPKISEDIKEYLKQSNFEVNYQYEVIDYLLNHVTFGYSNIKLFNDESKMIDEFKRLYKYFTYGSNGNLSNAIFVVLVDRNKHVSSLFLAHENDLSSQQEEDIESTLNVSLKTINNYLYELIKE